MKISVGSRSKDKSLLEKMRRRVRNKEELKRQVWVEKLVAMADAPSMVDSERLIDICGAVADKILEKGF
ncbi:MAG: hypothetical protein RSB82_04090 [Victivallaceae bacterium]